MVISKTKEEKNPSLYSNFMKGKTDVIHVHMTKASNLIKKVKAKASLLGLNMNDFVVRLLESNTQDINILHDKVKGGIK